MLNSILRSDKKPLPWLVPKIPGSLIRMFQERREPLWEFVIPGRARPAGAKPVRPWDLVVLEDRESSSAYREWRRVLGHQDTRF